MEKTINTIIIQVTKLAGKKAENEVKIESSSSSVEEPVENSSAYLFIFERR